MTLDVHQQRINRSRPRTDRRCDGCGAPLWDYESAWPLAEGQGFKRVDRCFCCCVYGPPRRPEGAPVIA